MAETTAPSLLRGVTIANEDGQTTWVDASILDRMLDRLIDATGERLREIKEDPELWDTGDLAEYKSSILEDQSVAVELREFLEESK